MTNNVYLDFIRRWAWLVVIGIVVGIVATNVALERRTDLYRSTATVQVGRTIQDSRPDLMNLSISDQLVPVYRELATRDPVLNAVIASLQLPVTVDSLRSRLLVQQVPQTQLIDIKVVDSDPHVAAAIANEVARQLVLQSPGDPDQDEKQRFIQSQLADLQSKITNAQKEITELEDTMAGLSSAAQVADAQTRLAALNAQVDTWQASFATLVSSSEPSQTNFVEVVGVAEVATTPIATPVALYYGLGIVIGGGMAAALALGLSTLFGAIRRAEDLRILSRNMPVMTIPYMRDVRRNPLVSARAPASPTAASYRVLRNILQTEQSDDDPVSIAVFSSRPGEGKTTTVANLAIVLASIRRNVILVDANVRNPSLDQMFGTDTTRGLSDVVMGDCDLADALQQTEYPNLMILGAGSIPGNYTDILSPNRVRHVFQTLSTMAEITLIDTPSIQEEQEALMLAREVDAAIVIVESGRLRASEVERTLEALSRTGVKVLSLALTKVRMSGGISEKIPFSRDARRRKLAEDRRSVRRPVSLTGDGELGSPAAVTSLSVSRNPVMNAHAATKSGRSESA